MIQSVYTRHFVYLALLSLCSLCSSELASLDRLYVSGKITPTEMLRRAAHVYVAPQVTAETSTFIYVNLEDKEVEAEAASRRARNTIYVDNGRWSTAQASGNLKLT